MSAAAAPALAPRPETVVVVRLADCCSVAAYVSFVFALGLAFFPVSFPSLITKNWFNGHLVLTLALGSCFLNAVSYLRVAYMLARKPGLLASAALGFFTVVTVVVLTAIEAQVVSPWMVGLANPQAHMAEEILAHTYFTLMSALFLPFLTVRLFQSARLRAKD